MAASAGSPSGAQLTSAFAGTCGTSQPPAGPCLLWGPRIKQGCGWGCCAGRWAPHNAGGGGGGGEQGVQMPVPRQREPRLCSV